jgi:hypothetical protein
MLRRLSNLDYNLTHETLSTSIYLNFLFLSIMAYYKMVEKQQKLIKNNSPQVGVFFSAENIINITSCG